MLSKNLIRLSTNFRREKEREKRRSRFSFEQNEFLEKLVDTKTIESFFKDGEAEQTLVDYNDTNLLVQCLRQCLEEPTKFWPLLERAEQWVYKSKFEGYNLGNLFRYEILMLNNKLQEHLSL